MISQWLFNGLIVVSGLLLLLFVLIRLRKKPLAMSTDRLVGISAIIISLCTLIIFIYQTELIREQSRLSVKPRIAFSSSQNQKDSTFQFRQVIINKGLGPAIIDSMALIYKGEYYELDMDEFLGNTFPRINEFGALTQSTTYVQGTTLRAGEESTFYTYRANMKSLDSLAHYLGIGEDDDDPFDFEVIYTSIYEDQFWKLSTLDSPVPVLLENYKQD
jgi:hypothetical protein